MKGFYRVICGAAAVLIGLGVLLWGVGRAMGASLEALASSAASRGGVILGKGGDLWGGDQVEATYEQVAKLDFELGEAEISIQEGDGFWVKAENVNARRFQTWQEGDTWVIRCEPRSHGLGWDRDRDRTPTIAITVPKGFVAREAELELEMGTLYVQDLSALESSISVGMGEMTLEGFTSGNCSMEIGMGTLTVSGKITGKGEIECGMGSAQLFLEGSPQDYGWTAEVGMGSVCVGTEEVSGPGGEVIHNPGAPNFFEIECGMGSVGIAFDTNI